MRTGGGLAEDERLRWENGRRKLADLRPQEDNPRHIDKDSVERLRTSWDDYGQVDALAVGPDGSIYNGHQRYYVLLDQFGPDHEVDVRVASRSLSRREWQRLTVFLHEGAVGDWDFDGLANWDGVDVGDLVDWGFDPAALGLEDWGKEEPPADPGAQIDKAAELQEKWGTALGQVWEVGRHRIVCGDCTDAVVVEKLMQGEKAGAVVTDPPYGIGREGITNDDPQGLRALFDGCVAQMPIENAVVIAFQSPRLFPVWLDAVRAVGHGFERALWFYDETDVCFPWRGWLMTSQIALVSSVGNPTWPDNIYHHDCYIVKTAGKQGFLRGRHEGSDGASAEHPTMKPLDIVEDLVRHTVGILYDPFLGSGTTLVACEQTGRVGRGIEIEPKYIAVSLERLTGMGLESKLVGTI